MRALLIVGMLLAASGCGAKPEADAPRETAPATPTLTGQATWFPLGDEIYQEADIEKNQSAVHSFVSQPRWFIGEKDTLSYPKTLEDVPLTDRGATLRFEVEEEKAADLLRFNLTLKAGGRPVFREVEHRWNNLVPLLFAFYSDGKAVTENLFDFEKIGGVNWWRPLAKAGEERSWSLLVRTDSILALLPSKDPQTVSVVVAFGERQHEGYFRDEKFRRLLGGNESSDPDENDAITHPILIRSNIVHLKWDGSGWAVSATP